MNASQLVGGGEFVQPLQPEVLEEKLRGAVEPWPAGGIGFAANLDQFAFYERLNNAIDGDAWSCVLTLSVSRGKPTN